MRILLDCQMSPNIDDAFALALALAAPELTLMGVTLARDLGGVGAATARGLADAYGRKDVSVHSGVHATIAEAKSRPCPAVAFLIEQIRALPGEITVVTTGPMTNLALAFRRAPDTARKVRSIVSMAGWTEQRLPEWNVMQDPEAAQVVLNSGAETHLFGLDVTFACQPSERMLSELALTPSEGTRLLLRLLDEWRGESRRFPVLHDPLTVAYLCLPPVANMEASRIVIERELGRFVMTAGRPSGSLVNRCTHVNVAAYFNVLSERLRHPGALPPPQPVLGLGASLSANALAAPELYNALSVRHRAGWRSPDQSRLEHQVISVIEGAVELTMAEQALEGRAGDVFVVPRGVRHTLATRSGARFSIAYLMTSQEAAGVQARTGVLNEPVAELLHASMGRVAGGDTPQVAQLVEQLVRMHQAPTLENELSARELLYRLLLLLVRAARDERVGAGSGVGGGGGGRADAGGGTEAGGRDGIGVRAATGAGATATAPRTYVQQAKGLIERQINQEISLAEVARAVGVSRHHLCRQFRAQYGITPVHYHTQLRLKRAVALLATGHLNVSEVAHELGFHSLQAFSRAFKRVHGASPTAFARSGRAG